MLFESHEDDSCRSELSRKEFPQSRVQESSTQGKSYVVTAPHDSEILNHPFLLNTDP